MKAPRVVVLGNVFRRDDGAALAASSRFPEPLLRAGRPGVDLIELLDRPTVLVDVVRAGMNPGSVLSMPLSEVIDASALSSPVSSHGLGPAEALRLGLAVGSAAPEGWFVGIEGRDFAQGEGLSPEVASGLHALADEVWRAWRELGGGGTRCTSTD